MLVRLADSLTHDDPPPDRLPARLDLGGRPAYRAVATETYGPLSHVRGWVLNQAGVKSDTMAGTQLNDFFSSDAFHRAGGVLNAGRTTTPPLFRDDSGRSPLGVFSVPGRVGRRRPHQRDQGGGTARHHAVHGPQRTQRGPLEEHRDRRRGRPLFQWFGLREGKFNLRLLLGGNVRYGSSRSRYATTGGTGAVKSAAQARATPPGSTSYRRRSPSPRRPAPRPRCPTSAATGPAGAGSCARTRRGPGVHPRSVRPSRPGPWSG